MINMTNLQDFFAIYAKAAWEKDSNTMIKLYDDDVLIFDMWAKAYQAGLSQWRSVIESWLGTLGEERVRVTFERTSVHDGSTIGFASALITYQAVAVDQTILRSMQNRITLGFAKKKDGWKVIHQHTSAPLDSNLMGILK